MGVSGEASNAPSILDQRIVITGEIRDASQVWRDGGATRFGLAGLPEEPSFSTPKLVEEGCCQFDDDCGDGNPCAEYACEGNACVHWAIDGCRQYAEEWPPGHVCIGDACEPESSVGRSSGVTDLSAMH